MSHAEGVFQVQREPWGPRTVEPDVDGLSLVEMLVALLLLGVLLSGFASALITFGRATAVNEYRLQSTSLLTSLHEELQATPWNRAVLYDEEVSALAGVEGVDLEGDVPRFEGEPIASIPGPVNTGCPPVNLECGRLVYVPVPREQVEIDDREFEILQIVTEAPVTGGSDPELRRFVTIVRWQLLGREYEQRFESQRAPTPDDRQSPGDPEVRLFVLNPRQIVLDPLGRNQEAIQVFLRFRPGIVAPRLEIPILVPDGDGGFLPDVESVTFGSADVDYNADDPAFPGWSTTISAGSLQLDPANTRIELYYTRDGSVEGVPAGTVRFAGGYPIAFVGFDSDGVADPDPGGEVLVRPSVSQVEPLGPIVVHVGSPDGVLEDRFCEDVTISASVAVGDVPDGDLAGLDGGVTATAWFAGNRNQTQQLSAGGGLLSPSGTEFEHTFTAETRAPWLLPDGEDREFRDRFHIVATAGPTGQDSAGVASAVITVRKAANGACP